MPKTAVHTSIEGYIAAQPPEKQPRLRQLYQVIKENAPNATERMSWQMPTFYQQGNVVHFATGKHHIGLYPGASGVAHFLPKLEGYKTSKGAIQLPDKDPLPLELVAEIVRFRVQENEDDALAKKQAKKANKSV